MPDRTLTVFRAGTFTTEPTPDWLRLAYEIADGEPIDWHVALSRALGSDRGGGEVIDNLHPLGVEVCEWMTPGGGRYVELGDLVRCIAEVWVPDPADWFPFQSTHLVPFIAAHAGIAAVHQLGRIGNALIAYARHGEGEHIETDTGHSGIDIARERARNRRGMA